MYCLRCGTKLSENARFCTNCGSTMLSEQPPVRTQASSSVQPARDHAIPLKRREADPVPVQEAPPVQTDRSIPVRRPGQVSVPEPEPEKKPEEIRQRAIAPPPAREGGPAPHPFAPRPLASVQHASDSTPAAAAAAAREDAAPGISGNREEDIPVTVPAEEPEVTIPAQPEVPAAAEETAVAAAIGQEPEAPEDAAENTSVQTSGESPEEKSTAPADEPESAASGGTSAEEAPAAGEDKKEKAVRTRKQYIAAAAAVVVLLAGIFYAFRIWPQKQFEKFYAVGSEALEQLDYETAAENLALAYKIKQDDPSLNEMLYRAYGGIFDQKVSEGDTEGAITAGRGMVGLIPENDEQVKESLGGLYLTYVRTLLMDGRLEKASGTVTAANGYVTDDVLTELQYLHASFSQLSSFAETVARMSDSGEHKDICTMIEEIKPLIITCSDTSSGRQPVVRVNSRSHEYVVFYRHSSGQYYIFYGDLTDEGQRQGKGTIYYDGRSTSKDMLYYYTSGWENDKPNGEFSEHEFTGSSYGTETIYEGSLKDGYFDGKISITWGSAGVYYGEYHNGRVTVQDIDEATGRYIIAYNEAHDDFLSFPKDPSSSRFGVDFY